MRRYGLSCLILWCFSLVILWRCSPVEPPTGTCRTNADCESGKRCQHEKCRPIPPANQPPVADAGEPQTVIVGTRVRLSGQKSTDPEKQPLVYAWTLVERPSGSQATLSDPAAMEPTFEADKEGSFVAELVVTDPEGAKSKSARVQITAEFSKDNKPPVASAGPDQIANIGATVKLDGSHSSDPDGDSLTYEWSFKTKPEGSLAKLSEPTSATPTFQPDKGGRYILALAVRDRAGLSDSDSVSIEVYDQILVPKLTKLTPVEAYTGTKVKVTLEGEDFREGAVVLFDRQKLSAGAAKFLSEKKLEVELDLTKVTPGSYPVQVQNPDGKSSSEILFKVLDLPTPKLLKLEPNSATSGSKLDVTARGEGFVQVSEVLFQSLPLVTTFKSPTELTFSLDLTKTPEGKYKVRVRNPGGVSSQELEFEVLPVGPPPVLNVLNPPSGVVDSKINFSVHGGSFASGAVIVFDGKAIPSKRIRRDEIDADPALDLTGKTPGKVKVWVRNPSGQESQKLEFSIEDKDPTPHIDRILPFTVYLDSSNTLAIYGERFRPGAQFFLGTTEIKPPQLSYKSATYMEAVIDTTKGSWQPGDVQAYVLNPKNKKSNTFKITISHLQPIITSVTPSGWSKACDTDVEIFGKNFLPTSIVQFGSLQYTATSTTHKLTHIGTDRLQFRLEATKLNATTHNLTVENSSVAKSSAYQFVIQAASTIPKPDINTMQPAGGLANTTVTVELTYRSPGYFLNGAVVELDGKRQKTTCTQPSSSYCSRLSAELDLSVVAVGEHNLQVANPCGIKSDKIPFYVSAAPPPYISTLQPAYAEVGSKQSIAVLGLNLGKQSKIIWDGKALATTFVSNKEIRTTQPIDFTTAQPGTIDVQVESDGKRTGVVKFTILAKQPTLVIDSITPQVFEREQSHHGIVVKGRGFTQKTELTFNQQKVFPVFNNSTQMTVNNVSFFSLQPGTYYFQAKEGTATSNAFPVLAKPADPPVLDRLNYSAIFEGGTTLSLFLYGKNFCVPQNPSASSTSCTTNPTVLIEGPQNKDYSANYKVQSSYIRQAWDNSYVYGTLDLRNLPVGVYKLQFHLPGGEKSNPVPLTIKPVPDPELTSLSPNYGFVGISFSLQINALHFCPINGTTCSTDPKIIITDDKKNDWSKSYTITRTYVSSSGTSAYIQGTLDATKLQEGTYTFQLEHPTSGKKSKALPFSLQKLPNPIIMSYSPTTGVSGVPFELQINALHFCPTNGSACSTNPKIYIRDANQNDWSSSFQITRTYVSSSWSSAYIQGTLDTTQMSAGSYIFQLEHPTTGGKSADVPYSLGPTPDPEISYLSPDYITVGSKQTVYVYGKYFAKGAFVMLGTGGLPTNYNSSTRLQITIDATQMKVGSYQIVVRSPSGKTSPAYTFSVVNATDAAITRITSPVYENQTYNPFYIYGRNWNTSVTTPDFLLDGKTIQVSNMNCSLSTSTSTCRLYNFSTVGLSAGQHTLQYRAVQGTTTIQSSIFTFTVGPPLPPTIERISPSPLYAGYNYSFYVYGMNWLPSVTDPDILLNGQVISSINKQCYVTSSSPYCRFPDFSAVQLKPGLHKLQYRAVSGGKTVLSPEFPFAITSAPAPTVTRISPTTIYAGRQVPYFYVYGQYWYPQITNPDILLNGTVIQSTQKTCYVTSPTSPYCRFQNFVPTGLQPGDHKLQYRAVVNGTTYTSPAWTFQITKPPAPMVTSISPNTATHGSTVLVRITGSEFTSGASVSLGLQTFAATYRSSTSLDVSINTSLLTKKTYQLIVTNPDLQSSNGVSFTVK